LGPGAEPSHTAPDDFGAEPDVILGTEVRRVCVQARKLVTGPTVVRRVLIKMRLDIFIELKGKDDIFTSASGNTWGRRNAVTVTAVHVE
jgi:hypothetical protein